ncbi:entericidin A/B family lipoprotein [Puniceibacterium sediminis]|uniref:Entericidin EcnA/B family protein n=1 Tax=Puniceibacterium sediminis TaxID=1608407 RepID=A0A238ZFG2_9RHOB|nr:entericidin A/B family lipoprotein [Puniceibacterium sediminis]SNR81832.1 Entericidin EcnA/B family protein [Puniceibacterium sediminis]
MLRIAVILSAMLALTACETIKGAGRDVQNAGQAIDNEI